LNTKESPNGILILEKCVSIERARAAEARKLGTV
jgi:hypothetical protein